MNNLEITIQFNGKTYPTMEAAEKARRELYDINYAIECLYHGSTIVLIFTDNSCKIFNKCDEIDVDLAAEEIDTAVSEGIFKHVAIVVENALQQKNEEITRWVEAYGHSIEEAIEEVPDRADYSVDYSK